MTNEEIQSARAELKTILLDKSVIIGEEDQFTLASGAKSNFYVDCRLTTMDARGAALVGLLGLRLFQESATSAPAIGGLTMGADPVGLAIAIASANNPDGPRLDAYAIRKEAKDHGRGRQIEGNFPENGGPVVVVDDVITTGGSTLKAIDAIDAAGGKAVLCIVLVDRQEGGRQAIEARGVPVASIFTKADLLG
ncbi:MAG: orotate phosphoribosyltransferase [Verrucomicrobiales bacterium]|nr:orotate phosphoribosyltransferase [Verrucomicrobiales bacterium]